MSTYRPRPSRRSRVAQIGLYVHTILATIVFAYVILDWQSSDGSSLIAWAIFMFLDFPISLTFFLIEWLAGMCGVETYFRYTTLPFLDVVVLGGVQWYLILSTLFPGSRRTSTSECMMCGYSLRGNTSRVCPECGTPIEEERRPPSPEAS